MAMLSMLRFCRAINYRSVWHVDAVRRLGAESTSRCLEHTLFLWVESSPGQSAHRQKSSTDTEKVKQKWRTLRFECFLLSFAAIAQRQNYATAARRNKCSSLLEPESIIIQETIHFIYPGEVRSKRQLLNCPGINIRSSSSWGMASTVWPFDAVRLPRIPS